MKDIHKYSVRINKQSKKLIEEIEKNNPSMQLFIKKQIADIVLERTNFKLGRKVD